MKKLVVAATHAEVQELVSYFKLATRDFVQHQKFDLLITGAGMTATAFALGKCLNERYDTVLNIGIAGSFDNTIAPGDVVNITEDIFSEFGADDNGSFIVADDLGLGKTAFKGGTIAGLRQVKGITVNKVHGSSVPIAKIIDRLQPQTESMEGAAVFYCCAKLGHTCFQVRSISNFVAPRNKNNWNIPLAVNNLNNWAINFLEQDTNQQ